MIIQASCGCVVTLKPYIPYFNRIFSPPYNTTISKLCNEHKTLLREETKLQLDRMYSEKLSELEQSIMTDIVVVGDS